MAWEKDTKHLIIFGTEEINEERYEDTRKMIEHLVNAKLEMPEINGTWTR